MLLIHLIINIDIFNNNYKYILKNKFYKILYSAGEYECLSLSPDPLNNDYMIASFSDGSAFLLSTN